MNKCYTGRTGEQNFESDFVNTLIQAGWEENVIKNPSIADVENNLRDIINHNNINKLGINHLLTDGEFAQIMNYIKLNCRTSVLSNIFINGRQVVINSEIERPKYKVSEPIYLDIFDPVMVAGGQSRYQIVEQPVFKTSKHYNNRRGDIMLLINGLPVIHIELKASNVPVSEGIEQIRKYKNEDVFSGIYSLVQVFFVATPEDIVYFANNTKIADAFIFHWGDMNNHPVKDWQDCIIGPNHILSIPEAHQLIGYYLSANVEKDSRCNVSSNCDGTLMVARSYQVHAIRAILKRVAKQKWNTHDQLGGYVWGTTGCGKTFTSYKAGQLIIDRNLADKVVFVVDRRELDDQSYYEYNALARDGEYVRKTESTYRLFQALRNDKDKLIITSIHKLSKVNEEKSKYVSDTDIDLINQKRIVFIVDEAHRSQFGEMHISVKNTFINALFIGFTGTPIFNENEKGGMTSDLAFGACLAIYSIASGIRDKNVLGFDPHMVRTFKDSDLKDAVACRKAGVSCRADAMSDAKLRATYDEWYNADMIDIEKEIPNVQYESAKHHEAVVNDILDNWDILSNRGSIRFHALFATSSIQEAIAYYHLFKNKSDLKVTALFDTNTNENSAFVIEKENALVEIVDDYNKMFGTNYNRDDDPQLKLFKRDVTSRLSHKGVYKHISDADMIDIVIVVDQLLTGFDSKYVNTLYLDKVLESDALIQAISRTNRVLDFNEKPWGIFKYYRKPYTMKQNIENALKLYCEGGSTNGVIVSSIDDNIIIANDYYRTIKDIFDIHHIKNFERLPSLQADCQKFKSSFLALKQLIHGMCLQGMNWNDDNDEYVLKLKVAGKWIDNHYRIFDILYKRYLESVSSREQSDFNGVAGYNVPAYVSEIGNEKIDADYLESHFKIVVPKLLNHVDDDVVRSFESQLGALSEMHQKYAKQIIGDIRSGELDVGDRSLYELIALYEATEETQQILDFSDKYGLDYDKLQVIYHKGGNIDLQVNDLLDTCDWHKAYSALGVTSRLRARKLLNKLIREFVR